MNFHSESFLVTKIFNVYLEIYLNLNTKEYINEFTMECENMQPFVRKTIHMYVCQYKFLAKSLLIELHFKATNYTSSRKKFFNVYHSQ